MTLNKIFQGDSLQVLKTFPDNLVDTIITSPPYWGLRDYGVEGQLGLEKTPDEYVSKMVEIFRELKRVLKKEGTCWLNLGDSYANNGPGSWGSSDKSTLTTGSKMGAWAPGKKIGITPPRNSGLKSKDLVGIPWRVAFSLQADGWYLRQDIIWHKPNPMPESVTDRCTKSHEYVFLLTKSSKYYYDNEVIKEKTITNDNSNRDRDNTKLNNTPGRTRMAGLKTNSYEMRNRRSVWTVNTKPYKEAHFATFPEKLIVPMVKAGCPEGGIILDPFMGAGTTAVVARKLSRKWIGIELNNEYIKIAEKRMQQRMLF